MTAHQDLKSKKIRANSYLDYFLWSNRSNINQNYNYNPLQPLLLRRMSQRYYTFASLAEFGR